MTATASAMTHDERRASKTYPAVALGTKAAIQATRTTVAPSGVVPTGTEL